MNGRKLAVCVRSIANLKLGSEAGRARLMVRPARMATSAHAAEIVRTRKTGPLRPLAS